MYRIFLLLIALFFSWTLAAQTDPQFKKTKVQTTATTLTPAQRQALLKTPSQATTVRTAKVMTPEMRLAAARAERARERELEEANNWGAAPGVISSTKKIEGSSGTHTAGNYAKIARKAGQTATETLREMRRGYPGIRFTDLLRHMLDAGYTWSECTVALRDHDKEPGPSMEILRLAGAPAGEAGKILERQYGFNQRAVIHVLNYGGYSVEQIIKASQDELRMPADHLFRGLKYIQADLAEAFPAVRAAYGFTDRNTVRLARAAGFSPPDLERVILTTVNPTSKDVTDLLRAAEVSPEEIVRVLHDRYKMGSRAVARIMKDDLGLPVDQAARLLERVYHLSPADAADALMEGAEYGYEQTKATLSKLYNMSLSDVVKLLSPWH